MHRTIIMSAAALGLLGACAHGGPPVSVSAQGGPPPVGSYRFLASPPGEQPGDFLVRPQVQARLAAGGFAPAAGAPPRYLVETAVTSRPEGSRTRACAVGFRFLDAATGAEAWRVRAEQRGRIADCNTENFRLVDAALGRLAAGR